MTAPDRERYLALPCRLVDAGSGDFLAIPSTDATDAGPRFLDADERLVLDALARPASTAELQKRLAAGSWEDGDPEYLMEIITELREAGLVTTESRLREALSRPSIGVPRTRSGVPSPDRGGEAAKTVSWVTGGRPRTLEASVRSVAEAGLTGSSGHEGIRAFRVFHDSAEAGVLADSRDRVEALAGETGIPAEFIGPQERAAFVSAMQSELAGRADSDLVAAAVTDAQQTGAISVGAIHNLWLLYAVDEWAASFDDDANLPFRRNRSILDEAAADNGALLSSAHDPTNLRLHETSEDLDSAAETVAAGLDALFSLLGPVAIEGLDIAEAGADLGAAILRDGLYTFAATAGIVGDAGMSRGYAPLYLEGADRRALWEQAPEQYEVFLKERLLSRHPARTTFSWGAHFMAPCFAADLRMPSLPFPPIGRNQDGVWRLALQIAFPGYLFAHLPFGILHTPPGGPRSIASPFDRPRPFANDFVMAAMLDARARGLQGGASLAAGLMSIAELSPRAFVTWARAAWVATLTTQLRNTELMLAVHRPEQNEKWNDAMERHVAAIRDAIEEPVVPIELEPLGPRAFEVLRALLRDYARILDGWAGLLTASRTVRAR